MSTLDQFISDTSQTSNSTETSENSTKSNYQMLMESAPGFLASLSALLEDRWALKTHGAISSLKSLGLLGKNNHAFYCSKTSKAYYLTTKGALIELSEMPSMKWGIQSNGNSLTANITYHRTESASSLLDILEAEVPEKYYLSEKAMQGIMTHNQRHRERGNGFSIRLVEQSMPTTTKDTEQEQWSQQEPNLKQIGNIDQKNHNSIWGRVYDSDGISATLNANGGGLGAKTGLYAIPVLTPDRAKKRQNGRRFKEDGDPMFTLTTQDQHGIFDGFRIRRLTPKECERLQTFPEGWTDNLSDTQRYKCIGNAVTVKMIKIIADLLK